MIELLRLFLDYVLKYIPIPTFNWTYLKPIENAYKADKFIFDNLPIREYLIDGSILLPDLNKDITPSALKINSKYTEIKTAAIEKAIELQVMFDHYKIPTGAENLFKDYPHQSENKLSNVIKYGYYFPDFIYPQLIYQIKVLRTRIKLEKQK